MILFLDFDGVTHPVFPRGDYSDEENALFAFLPRIEAVLEDFPGVRVVVSSSWRERRTLDDLRLFFSEDFRHRVIGATPLLDQKEPPYSKHVRQTEIEMWLAANGEGDTPWLALDDLTSIFVPDCPNLLLCKDGFRDDEETALRDWLRERRR